ncbi:hypothetical protein Tco_1530231 [Tanacetum coccineum]
MDSGFAVPVFSPGDDPIACLNKAMAFLTVVAASRFPSTNNQLRTSSNPRNQATIQDGRVTVQQVQGRQGQSYSGTGYKSNATSSGGNNASGQARTEDLDTYDSDYDDISNAQAVLMANISNYGSNVISEVPHSETNLNDMENQDVQTIQDFEQTPGKCSRYSFAGTTRFNDIICDRTNANNVVMLVIDDEETLILEEESRSKMSEKEKDPEAIKQNISHKPIDYEKLNRLSDDFGKHFTPQQELSAEQAFWLCMSNPTSKPSDASPIIIEAPKELPKVSLVNVSLKKFKFHLAKFDNVVKIRTTPDACKEYLLNEIMKVQTVVDQMDAAVQQSSVDKQYVLLTVMNSMSLIDKSVNMDRKRNESCDKCFNLEAELLKSQNALNDLLKKFFENNDLKAQLQDKDSTICKLNDIIKSMRENSKEENVKYDYGEIETKNVELENSVAKLISENECLLKGKEIVDIAAKIPSANTIVPGMFKLELEPLAPRLLQNREAHIDYLKYTQEQADILQGIVEQAKVEQPLDKELDFAYGILQKMKILEDLLKKIKITEDIP